MNKIDGQESVEMQIDIHLMDLVDNIDPAIVFAGLLYVANYRLPQLVDMDPELMRRLLELLLDYIKDYDDAFLVFTYFCKFPAFLSAISNVNLPYLKKRLQLQDRISTFRQQVVYVLQQIEGLPNINVKDMINDIDLLKETEISQITSLPPMNILAPQLLYTEKSVDRLFEMFKNDKNGLDDEQYKRNLTFYGQNKLPEPPKTSYWKLLIDQFKDFMVLLLIVVVIIELATSEFEAAGILVAVVVLNVLIGFIQEIKANRAMEALSNLSVPKTTVVRKGVQKIIFAKELVPGDIVSLNEGDLVPADGRVIESNNLQVIESILTGESLPIPKTNLEIRNSKQRVPIGECTGNVFMTTLVARGTALMMVTRTGNYTEIGRISAAIQNAAQPPSPIQRKLDKLGMLLVAMAIILCIIFVLIRVAWGKDIVETIQFGMVLAISAIPEGLVAVVTVTMALGVSRMAKRNAVVRKLPIVETLGSLTCICSDKTGTLTVGKMGLSVFVPITSNGYSFTNSTSLDPKENKLEKYNGDGSDVANFDLNKALQADKTPININIDSRDPAVTAVMMVCALCVNASISFDTVKSVFVGVGDATEVPLVSATQKLKLDKSFFEEKLGFRKQSENAFDSDRKLMSVVYKTGDIEVVLIKGAPESVLSKSSHYFNPIPFQEYPEFISNISNQKQVMTPEIRKKWIENANNMASYGLRVLGLAIKASTNHEEVDLCFVGFCGLIDPPKEGVKESIATAKSGGIKVIMITGDHINTATAIAKQIGLINPLIEDENRAMRGHEIDALRTDELHKLKPFPRVFARVSPDNKLKIVQALQSRGEVVAMTGDGVNDASAIKQADVGIAMGLTGTDITKQAADVILADDNFSTIIVAVEEGRRVFDNIVKFMVYLLSCNSAEIFLMLLSAVINVPLPYTAKSTLWANIIADVPPAMSLGVEPKEPGLMTRKPRNPSHGVIRRDVAIAIVTQGFMLTLITLAVYLISFKIEQLPLDISRTIAFTSLTTMQLVQSFMSKSITESVFKSGITSNRWMIFAFFLSLILMIMGIYIPYLNTFLTLVPIDAYAWLKVLIAVVVQFVLCELIKLVFRMVLKKKNYQPVPSVQAMAQA